MNIISLNTWGIEEKNAVMRCLEAGQFTMGENVARFEKDFAEKFGTKYAVMCSSGSTANLVGVAACFFRKENPLKAGDEVIVPAISWATTYYPLQQYGLKLRFVDVDLQTLNLDVTKLEQALTPKTKMVVAVSILGNPAQLDVMRAFCDKHNLILFEDNCESMGASLNGKNCGTFGHFNTFSKRALDRYTENIVAMLAELPAEFHEQSGGGMSFIYGAMNRDGWQWGEQYHVEELVMLGIGINRVQFQFPRDLWPLLSGGLPYFMVTAEQQQQTENQ
jgi:hypothetical protein